MQHRSRTLEVPVTGKTAPASSKGGGPCEGICIRPGLVSLLYAGIGGLWIVVTDIGVEWMFADGGLYAIAQILKGMLYVAFTAVFVYWLAWRASNSQEKLQRHGEQYRLLAENTLDLIWSMTMELDFTFVNPAVKNQMGYTPEEFAGTNLAHHCPPEEMKRLHDVIGNEIASHGTEHGVLLETEMLHKNGTHVPVEVHGTVLYDKHGNPVGLQGTTRDISERKEVRKELEKSERRFRTLFEEAAEGVIIGDAETTELLYANPAMCRMLGYSQAELRHMQVRDIHPKDSCDGVLREYHAIRGKHHFSPTEQPVVTKHGEIRYADITAAPMTIDDRSCNVGFFRDVTERKQLQEHKKTLEAQLLQSQRLESLGVFAGGVAHEINNPIMGITGYADLISQEALEGTDILEYTSAIKRETNKVHSLIRNLLTFARTEEEDRPPEATSLPAIVEATLSLIRTIIRHDNIVLDVEIPESLPPVLCRQRQIQQVLMNLLINARDALNEKYPDAHENKRIRLVAEPLKKEDGEWVRLTIEDRGTGISDDTREHIFEPFYTTKGEGVGTGLGMSIVHGIVTDHGGTISVESEKGEFTRIHVDLPTPDSGTASEHE